MTCTNSNNIFALKVGLNDEQIRVDSYLKGLSSNNNANSSASVNGPPESLVLPTILSAWVTGSLEEEDMSSQLLFCLHLSPFIDGKPLSDPSMKPFVETNCRLILYLLVEHFYLVQKWSTKCTPRTQNFKCLYVKDSHRGNFIYKDGKLYCVDYGCLTTRQTTIYDYLENIQLNKNNLGIDLEVYLAGSNGSIID